MSQTAHADRGLDGRFRMWLQRGSLMGSSGAACQLSNDILCQRSKAKGTDVMVRVLAHYGAQMWSFDNLSPELGSALVNDRST